MTTKKLPLIAPILCLAILLGSCSGADSKSTNQKKTSGENDSIAVNSNEESLTKPVDSAKYFALQKYLANGDTTGKWPVKNDVLPIDGAILPFHRVIAYYGNLYSKKMGALGEYAPKDMWRRLNAEVAKWNKADTMIKSIPAIHYIATVASGEAGKTGFYNNRMPEKQID